MKIIPAKQELWVNQKENDRIEYSNLVIGLVCDDEENHRDIDFNPVQLLSDEACVLPKKDTYSITPFPFVNGKPATKEEWIEDQKKMA